MVVYCDLAVDVTGRGKAPGESKRRGIGKINRVEASGREMASISHIPHNGHIGDATSKLVVPKLGRIVEIGDIDGLELIFLLHDRALITNGHSIIVPET